MATVTFDTLKFANKLKAAGVAEDLRREFKEYEMRFDAKLERLEGKLVGNITAVRGEITLVRGEITLLKWMLGVLLAGVVSLVLKAFFV